MSSKKHHPFESLIRYIPLVALLLGGGGLGGWYTLKNDVANASEKIAKLETEKTEDDKEYQELQIQQTRLEGKIDRGMDILTRLEKSMDEKKK